MENLLGIALNSVFVGNILLAYFLGMCSFPAVSKQTETAAGLGFAVVFVILTIGKYKLKQSIMITVFEIKGRCFDEYQQRI